MNNARIWSIYVPKDKEQIKIRIDNLAKGMGLKVSTLVLSILEEHLENSRLSTDTRRLESSQTRESDSGS
jgi:antitoxin component of RelBE/YafQ-DinJ toxin-antitoxin module